MVKSPTIQFPSRTARLWRQTFLGAPGRRLLTFLGHISPGRNRPEGFSLMELLVVLVLLAFLAGITGPALGRFLDGLTSRKQTGKILAAFRYGRLQSVARGEAVHVSLGEGENTIRFSGGITETRTLDLGEDESVELQPAEVTFYPEGQVTPGKFIVSRGGSATTFVLDPLTGMALVE